MESKTESKNKSWLVSRDFKNFHLSQKLQNTLSKLVNIEVSTENGHYEVVLRALSHFMATNGVHNDEISEILTYYDSKLNKTVVKKATQPNLVVLPKLTQREHTLSIWLKNELDKMVYSKIELYDHLLSNKYATEVEINNLKAFYGD